MSTTQTPTAEPAQPAAERASVDEHGARAAAATETHRLPPFAGSAFEVVYDGLAAINDYDADGRTVRYAITAGALRGTRGEASYHWREIAAHVYAISWQEADGASVVHVDDFAHGTSLSFFTTPSLALYRLAGTLRPVDA